MKVDQLFFFLNIYANCMKALPYEDSSKITLSEEMNELIVFSYSSYCLENKFLDIHIFLYIFVLHLHAKMLKIRIFF